VPLNMHSMSIVFDTAIELCLAAHPTLEREDVTPARAYIPGTPLYRVAVPPEHVDLIRDTANALWIAEAPNVANVHDDLIRKAEQIADETACPTPEGWK